MLTMHLLPILALSASPGGSAVDEMLRLIGIAAIVWAFFKGLKSLVAKPATAPPATTPVPVPVAVVAAPTPAPVTVPTPSPVAAVATPVVSAAPPVQPEGLAPELIALIAAAVTTVLGSAHRIVAIKSQSSHWEMAGRQSILTSHRIR